MTFADKMKLRKQDINGRPLGIGATVRVVGTPDSSNWTPSQKRFSLHVFRYLCGKYKRIAGFNAIGMAEVNFRMKRRGKWEMHTVWIEPHLLRERQTTQQRTTGGTVRR